MRRSSEGFRSLVRRSDGKRTDQKEDEAGR